MLTVGSDAKRRSVFLALPSSMGSRTAMLTSSWRIAKRRQTSSEGVCKKSLSTKTRVGWRMRSSMKASNAFSGESSTMNSSKRCRKTGNLRSVRKKGRKDTGWGCGACCSGVVPVVMIGSLPVRSAIRSPEVSAEYARIAQISVNTIHLRGWLPEENNRDWLLSTTNTIARSRSSSNSLTKGLFIRAVTFQSIHRTSSPTIYSRTPEKAMPCPRNRLRYAPKNSHVVVRRARMYNRMRRRRKYASHSWLWNFNEAQDFF